MLYGVSAGADVTLHAPRYLLVTNGFTGVCRHAAAVVSCSLTTVARHIRVAPPVAPEAGRGHSIGGFTRMETELRAGEAGETSDLSGAQGYESALEGCIRLARTRLAHAQGLIDGIGFGGEEVSDDQMEALSPSFT